VALWRDLGLPYEEAHTRLLVGRAARGLGDEEGATLEIQAARAAYERLGPRADANQAWALLVPLRDRPSGVTARGTEVLRLIAAGRSNREIAGTLRVSRFIEEAGHYFDEGFWRPEHRRMSLARNRFGPGVREYRCQPLTGLDEGAGTVAPDQ
jgi:hypothetical protein